MLAAQLDPICEGLIRSGKVAQARLMHSRSFLDLSPGVGLAFPRTSACAFVREGTPVVSAMMSRAVGPGCRWPARRHSQHPGAPGSDDFVCSVTGCSLHPSGGYFYLRPPGNPKPGRCLCPPGIRRPTRSVRARVRLAAGRPCRCMAKTLDGSPGCSAPVHEWRRSAA
jgi:hypothetical protein